MVVLGYADNICHKLHHLVISFIAGSGENPGAYWALITPTKVHYIGDFRAKVCTSVARVCV